MSVLAGGAETPTTGTYSIVSGTNWTVELMPSTFPEAIVTDGEIGDAATDLLAIGVFEEAFEVTKKDDEVESVKCISETLMDKDEVLGGAVSYVVAKGDFKGELGKSAVVRGGGKTRNVGFFGLGKKADAILPAKWGRSAYYKFGSQLAMSAKGQKCESVTIMFDATPEADLSEVVSHVIRALLLEAYESTRYKQKPKKNPLKTITLMNMDASVVEAGVKKAYAFAKGTLLTFYLIESPANVCYPGHLADAAAMIQQKFPETFELKAAM